MKIGSIILGRPWIYDVDLTSFGHTNQCSFLHDGRQIQWHPFPPTVTLQSKADEPIPQFDMLVPVASNTCLNPHLPNTITTSNEQQETTHQTKCENSHAPHLSLNLISPLDTKPIDLIPLPLDTRISESAEEFTLHDLHEFICKQINSSNETYKCLADSHRHHQEF